MISDLGNLFDRVISIFSTYDIVGDTLDILFLAFLVYFVLKLFRDSRAITLARGLFVFAVAYALVNILEMKAAIYLFRIVLDNILVILVVIFVPEIRKALETLGNRRTWRSLAVALSRGSAAQKAMAYNEEVRRCVNSVCKAANDMSEKRIGALVVFEKNTPLGDVIEMGTRIDATVTSTMLENIFYPGAPLHDGAAIIRNNQLHAAGCILPLTSRNNDVAKDLGTRHRAAIGMSEQSDAMILVVSEETGAMSIAEGGMLLRNLTDGEVRETLLNFLQIGGEKHGN
ncbi:MAG TPA: diadenylate cyclase CdaA [Clostridiales bacterium]|nr:diadenylate cyclase CdaA [Clostridiales bacterium]